VNSGSDVVEVGTSEARLDDCVEECETESGEEVEIGVGIEVEVTVETEVEIMVETKVEVSVEIEVSIGRSSVNSEVTVVTSVRVDVAVSPGVVNAPPGPSQSSPLSQQP
jgi:hypothetical protein